MKLAELDLKFHLVEVTAWKGMPYSIAFKDGMVVPKATAIKPGKTTTTGINIFRNPANIKPF